MMKKFYEKKGELSTQQIILLLILIASFIIILFFLFRLNINSGGDAEICHNSVVTRGSSVVPSNSVPLKCSTEYVCITEDGSCEGLENPRVEKVKTENEVYAVLADEMAECWWMFGAGEIDYIQNDVLKHLYCSICSQILFDESLKEIEGLEEGNISKDKLYDFLTIASYSEGQSYSEYIFGTNDVEDLKRQFLESSGEDADYVTFGNIRIGNSHQYYNVMGIVSERGIIKTILVGIGTGGLIYVFTPIGIIGGAILAIGGGIAGGTVGDEISGLVKLEILGIVIEGEGIKNDFLAPTIIEINSENFDALDCKDVNTLS